MPSAALLLQAAVQVKAGISPVPLALSSPGYFGVQTVGAMSHHSPQLFARSIVPFTVGGFFLLSLEST